MSNRNIVQLPILQEKKKIMGMIKDLRIELLVNENKLESILKDPLCYENVQLQNQINTCFMLHCKLEDNLEKIKELELKENYIESNNIIINFISNISNVQNDSGPEALIVVTSEEVKKMYINLISFLALKNVIIVTIEVLTAGYANLTLYNVNTALLDGSEADYAKFECSEPVRQVISENVSADRLFIVRDDVHRDVCFKQVFLIKHVQ